MKDGYRDKVWSVIFSVLLVLGVYATFVRFSRGLGAATNLSDEFPWGLWIGFDILVGVGLAAGGFVIAATVHIFQLKKYAAIARPAILTAFLGYLLVIVALLFDLGRPYRIWHPLVMGNPHSVMFEVAICVMLYTAVLAAEFSPLLFARLNLRTPLKIVRAIYIPLVIVGVLLSTLHQSSLGTLYVIVPDKLHGLWYTPLLPVFFFLSAIAVGLAMTIFESFMSLRAFGKRLEHGLLEGLARALVVILAVLLVWKLQNLHERGALHLAFEVTQESVMFWGELFLGVALPMVLFMIPRVRASQAGLFFGAMLTVMGFILNRLNVAITGLVGASGVRYIPSWMEFAITACIVAIGFVLFGLAVRHLDVFPSEGATEPTGKAPTNHRPLRAAFQGRLILALWILLIAGFLVLGFSTRWENGDASHDSARTAQTAPRRAWTAAGLDVRLVDEIKIAGGEDSPGVVVFNHSSHVDPDEPACGDCHAGAFRILGAGSGQELRNNIMFHDPGYCGKCHDGDNSFNIEEDCENCHQMD